MRYFTHKFKLSSKHSEKLQYLNCSYRVLLYSFGTERNLFSTAASKTISSESCKLHADTAVKPIHQ